MRPAYSAPQASRGRVYSLHPHFPSAPPRPPARRITHIGTSRSPTRHHQPRRSRWRLPPSSPFRSPPPRGFVSGPHPFASFQQSQGHAARQRAPRPPSPLAASGAFSMRSHSPARRTNPRPESSWGGFGSIFHTLALAGSPPKSPPQPRPKTLHHRLPRRYRPPRVGPPLAIAMAWLAPA